MIFSRSSLQLPLHNVNRIEGRMKMYGITLIFWGGFCFLVGVIKILQSFHSVKEHSFYLHDMVSNFGYPVQKCQYCRESMILMKRFGTNNKSYSYHVNNRSGRTSASNNKQHVSIMQKLNPFSSYRKKQRAEKKSSNIQPASSSVKSNSVKSNLSTKAENNVNNQSKNEVHSSKLVGMKQGAGGVEHNISPVKHIETYNHAKEVNHINQPHPPKSGNESPIELHSARNSFSDTSHHIDESYPGIQALKMKPGKSTIRDKNNSNNSKNSKEGEKKKIKFNDEPTTFEDR